MIFLAQGDGQRAGRAGALLTRDSADRELDSHPLT